ncbi:MAG: nuclear transport factor 2 family protein [Myxococcaceae bacterium]|nr:nuclear transport factor 2 family protein [Myxococcaceae bacterium]
MSAHPNAALLTSFYEAFQRKDGAAMAALYADDVTFSDEVFVGLEGPRAGAMWRMLCKNGKDLELTFSGVEADDAKGKAHWEARYTFSLTGRKVHNVIDATFTFKDGRIATHVDRFDFYRWARQALGVTGLLLGWTPLVKNKVRAQASASLDRFVAGR